MKTYKIYELIRGESLECGTVRANTAVDAIRAGRFGIRLDSPIESDAGEDCAWQKFPDHSDQSEHLYFADRKQR
jgi:hypothetical protein